MQLTAFPKFLLLLIILFALLASFLLDACKNGKRGEQKEKDAQYKKEEILAKKHCSSCHSYVAPDMLDRITWPRVLGVMKIEMDKKSYPIDQEEWIKVQQFYLHYAPKAFFSSPQKILPAVQTLFIGEAVKNPINTLNNTTLLKYLDEDSRIYVGKKDGAVFNLVNGELEKKLLFPNIPIDLKYANQTLLMLGMGSLKPSEDRTGQLLALYPNDLKKILVDSLKRPVNFQLTDIDNDGKKEYLIASFGSTVGAVASGKLSIFNGTEEIVLDQLPGAIQAKIADLDKNGSKEIIALFTQGNEVINLYSALPGKQFKKCSLIAFPPVYGTNSFELADINEDGFLDILVTSGDNDDYSQVFKPYHGIRIYLNDQQNNFKEAYFYCINGAAKVRCADMDKDGDIDFVVLAMYPDLFSRPWETLLYFENKGKLNFEPQYFENSPTANWILMEVADIDQDGDQDIITAANIEITGLVPPVLMQRWKDNSVALKIYYNKNE